MDKAQEARLAQAIESLCAIAAREGYEANMVEASLEPQDCYLIRVKLRPVKPEGWLLEDSDAE